MRGRNYLRSSWPRRCERVETRPSSEQQAWEAEPDSETKALLLRASELERRLAEADDAAGDEAAGGDGAEAGRRRRRAAEIRYALEKAAGDARARRWLASRPMGQRKHS